MMKLRFSALAAAAALCTAGAAQATVINFDNPGLIDINGNVATYTESGYNISGQAADFLTLNDALVGGFAGAQPFTLSAVGGGAFALASFDFDYFDLGDTPGSLTVTGLLDGVQVASASIGLTAAFAPGSAFFVGPWGLVNAVTFVGTSGFSLDNISVTTVPEPGGLALVGAGLAGVAASRVRRRRLFA